MIERLSCANNHIVVVNIVHRSQFSGGMETTPWVCGTWFLSSFWLAFVIPTLNSESENVKFKTILSFFSFSIHLCSLWGSVCDGNAVSVLLQTLFS